MRLWIWQVYIKNSLTHLSHIISHYFSWKKVGSENFSHPYAMFQFINTGRSDLISFPPFDNYIQYLWFSCFSLQAPFTLIVRSLYCIPECFLTNGISALFATWSFLLSKSQDYIQHLPVFYNRVSTTVCYVKLHIHILYSMEHLAIRSSELRVTSLSIFSQMTDLYLMRWISFSKQF